MLYMYSCICCKVSAKVTHTVHQLSTGSCCAKLFTENMHFVCK